MRCPFCGTEAPRPELHAHLSDSHGDRVETGEDGWGKRFYQLTCPLCGDSYRREVKPRLRDPTFLDEYAREIRIVAFDQFIYHLEGAHFVEHEEETSG